MLFSVIDTATQLAYYTEYSPRSELTLAEIGAYASILGVVIAAIGLIFKYRREIMDFFSAKKDLDITNLARNLEKSYIRIQANDGVISNGTIKKRKFVFFPVVPRKAFDIKHVTFANTIMKLEELGLCVYVFIYDDYYRKLNPDSVPNNNQETYNAYINEFIHKLRKNGIKRMRIIKQSEIHRGGFFFSKTRTLINTVMENSSNLTVHDVDELNKLEKINTHDST